MGIGVLFTVSVVKQIDGTGFDGVCSMYQGHLFFRKATSGPMEIGDSFKSTMAGIVFLSTKTQGARVFLLQTTCEMSQSHFPMSIGYPRTAPVD